MPRVSQFTSAFAKTSSPPVEIDQVLNAIKSGFWEKQISALRKLKGKEFDAAKKKLAAFTVTGVFSRHNDEGFMEHSGFVQCDVDAADNPDSSYEELWEKITKCPHVYAAFRSPSGRGIKVIVKCPADRDLHAGSYTAAARWLMDRGVNVDTKVCALSQLCFVSSDPYLYINKKAKPVEPVEVEPKDHPLQEFEETRTKEEVLAQCTEQHPDVFPDLWAGDYQEHHSDHSTADHQLICILRDNCHSNELVAEMFAESGLYRPDKWNNRTRDYVFSSLRSSSMVAGLSLLTPVPDDPEDPEPPRKRKHGGWAWEAAGAVPDWAPEDDNYIIKHLLHEGTLTCIYGAPGSGKTFCIFSMCAAIATGSMWKDHKVKKGGVLYFGLEGRHGIKKRRQAMKKEGLIDGTEPFAVVQFKEDALNMLDEDHIKKVCDTVKAYEEETGVKCKLIVVDTLARATPGGDENSTKDMGQAVVNSQAVIDKTGCCVLLVHHTGKEANKGMRGSSALLGGLDASYEVFRHPDDDTIRVFHVKKSRDEADQKDIYFKLRTVSLGVDADLEEVTTCLVDFIEAADVPAAKAKAGKKSKSELLLEQIPDEGISYDDLLKKSGIPRTTFQRQLAILIDDTMVKKQGDLIVPILDSADDDDYDPTADLV